LLFPDTVYQILFIFPQIAPR